MELTVHAQALVAEGKVHKNAAYPAPLEASYDKYAVRALHLAALDLIVAR